MEREGNDPTSSGFSDQRSDLISYLSILVALPNLPIEQGEGSSYPLTIQFRKLDKTTDNLLICAVHCASSWRLTPVPRFSNDGNELPFTTF